MELSLGKVGALADCTAATLLVADDVPRPVVTFDALVVNEPTESAGPHLVSPPLSSSPGWPRLSSHPMADFITVATIIGAWQVLSMGAMTCRGVKPIHST
eukprot:3969754-Amphidinium_carterae.1